MKNSTLKDKIEEIMDELDNFAFEHEEAEKRASTLEEKDHELRAFENRLAEQERAIKQSEERLMQENEAVQKQAEINLKKQIDIDKAKDSLAKLGQYIVESEEAEKRLKAENDLLDKKKKELGDLEALKEDLEKREALLAKEKAIINESNRVLDIRRQKITAREAQLQIEAEIE